MAAVDGDQFRPLDQMVEWADNYNRGDVEAIARSIRRFGFNNAPRVWRDDIVMAGNHTVMALKLIQQQGPDAELDQQWPPRNVRLDGDVWTIQCVDVSHLNDVEALAFAVTDNHLARQAVADETLLAKYLQTIHEADPAAFTATGFTDESFKAMLAYLTADMVPDFEPVDETEQPRMDRKNPITCPCCGCEFVRDG